MPKVRHTHTALNTVIGANESTVFVLLLERRKSEVCLALHCRHYTNSSIQPNNDLNEGVPIVQLLLPNHSRPPCGCIVQLSLYASDPRVFGQLEKEKEREILCESLRLA